MKRAPYCPTGVNPDDLPPGWEEVRDNGMTKVFQIRVYDRVATVTDEDGNEQPACYIIEGDS